MVFKKSILISNDIWEKVKSSNNFSSIKEKKKSSPPPIKKPKLQEEQKQKLPTIPKHSLRYELNERAKECRKKSNLMKNAKILKGILSPEDRERALIRKNIQTDNMLDFTANTAPTIAQQAQTLTVAQQADMYNLRTTAERKPTQKFTPSTHNQQKTKKKNKSGSEKRRHKIRQEESEKEKENKI